MSPRYRLTDEEHAEATRAAQALKAELLERRAALASTRPVGRLLGVNSSDDWRGEVVVECPRCWALVRHARLGMHIDEHPG